MWVFGVFGFIATLLEVILGSVAVTEDDIRECGTSIFSRVNCTSIRFFYRECPVPGATDVNKIKLSQNFSLETCIYEVSFGFRANVVWVTEGCSAEFYVCYNGVVISTTQQPGRSPTVEIPRESVEDPTDKATIYIAIAVTLALLVLVGLIVGCFVKRRQSTEKSRKLAERRQISLETRDSKVDDDIQITPIRRQSSSESMYFPEGTVDLDRFEKGSVCSSRSSTSGFGSVSSRATGRYMSHGKPVSGGLSLVLDPRDVYKTGSVPDVRAVYIEQNLKSNQSYKGSQTSLESIPEIKSSFVESQNGGQRRRYSQRPFKYNTVGFRGNCADNLYNQNRNGLTMPGKRLQTRAVVHARRASQDSGISRLTKSGSDMNIISSSHYEDPEEILKNGSNTTTKNPVLNREKDTESKREFRPISPANCSTDCLYSTVKKPNKPVILPKPSKDIYASVNRPRCGSPDSASSLEENNNEHLHDAVKDAEAYSVVNDNASKRQNYAFMHTFKPTRDYEEVDISTETGPHLSRVQIKAVKF